MIQSVRSLCLSVMLLAAVMLGMLVSRYAVAESINGVNSESVIIDSKMTSKEAFAGLSTDCPEKIRRRQKLIEVKYYSFDKKIHQGQLVIDAELENDVKTVFSLAFKQRFPLQSVIPIAAKQFGWDDNLSMAANNTSVFNYRFSVGSTHLSKHAYGRAIDINPFQNPYIKGTVVLPKGAKYDPAAAGTLTKNHPIVRAFVRLGWTWGGSWISLKDYQHFQKPLKE
ncbi:M15 family metallopeptidase [Desulfobulbus sp. F5]|nr:M15 family metallopeptidase [Desulfobulbus sp. F5]